MEGPVMTGTEIGIGASVLAGGHNHDRGESHDHR